MAKEKTLLEQNAELKLTVNELLQPDVSPTRWHLAHTTWFFETFVLASAPGYESFHPDYAILFNSYYNAVGQQFPRPRRGLLSRPGLDEENAACYNRDTASLDRLQAQSRLRR